MKLRPRQVLIKQSRSPHLAQHTQGVLRDQDQVLLVLTEARHFQLATLSTTLTQSLAKMPILDKHSSGCQINVYVCFLFDTALNMFERLILYFSSQIR